MAEVSIVETSGGRRLACKKLKSGVPEKIKSRFRQEIRIQSSLDHPNIVKVLLAASRADPPYYYMPIADGNLFDDIKGIMQDPGKLIAIADQLLSALEYAHERRVLHRDLKPHNVLRFGDLYKISDFGLGKAINVEASYTTTTSDAWGTYWYAPPEQDRGLSECDERSDIYSFGKLLLHCLTAERPNEVPDTIDTKWAYIIRRCIRDDADKRWPSIATLKSRFDLIFEIDEADVVDPEDILGMLKEMALGSSSPDEAAIAEFAKKASCLLDDEILLRKVVDAMPRKVIAGLANYDQDFVNSMVKVYDESLGEYLDFDYCDIVANRYAAFHEFCNNI